MEFSPWAEVGGEAPGAPVAPTPPEPPARSTEHRLAAIEGGLTAIGQKIDDLAETLEATLRESIAKDVERVATDLRHTVSELGRLLVKDLGRLSKILSEHRDAIVAEVRATDGQPAPSPAPPPAAGATAEATEIPVADGGPKQDAAGADSGWRAGRRRRR
jgi:hypothetical protein